MTHERRPILTTAIGRQCLRDAIATEQSRAPFAVDAIVLLPDHLHAIWTLPDGDADYSTRWGKIKERFTRSFLAAGGREGRGTDSRAEHRERAVWQHRFWEHTIADDDDFKRCLDYIHWNPVKHGFAARTTDYPWSSFARYVGLGEYTCEWGTGFVCPAVPGAEWE